MSKRVYLAGPDVFFKEAPARAAMLKELCAQYGLEGVHPLDGPSPAGVSKLEDARQIFEADVRMIRSCQGVIANMIPFRGPSADVGTAWEMGFAAALGLPVIGYTTSARTYIERVEGDEFSVEDFGLVDNLMLVMGANCRVLCAPDRDLDNGARLAIVEMAVLLDKEPSPLGIG
jgi:nucleoside 2-deoxyribosyltransferase